MRRNFAIMILVLVVAMFMMACNASANDEAELFKRKKSDVIVVEEKVEVINLLKERASAELEAAGANVEDIFLAANLKGMFINVLSEEGKFKRYAVKVQDDLNISIFHIAESFLYPNVEEIQYVKLPAEYFEMYYDLKYLYIEIQNGNGYERMDRFLKNAKLTFDGKSFVISYV